MKYDSFEFANGNNYIIIKFDDVVELELKDSYFMVGIGKGFISDKKYRLDTKSFQQVLDDYFEWVRRRLV